jgi:hypothetical protein
MSLLFLSLYQFSLGLFFLPTATELGNLQTTSLHL